MTTRARSYRGTPARAGRRFLTAGALTRHGRPSVWFARLVDELQPPLACLAPHGSPRARSPKTTAPARFVRGARLRPRVFRPPRREWQAGARGRGRHGPRVIEERRFAKLGDHGEHFPGRLHTRRAAWRSGSLLDWESVDFMTPMTAATVGSAPLNRKGVPPALPGWQ